MKRDFENRETVLEKLPRRHHRDIKRWKYKRDEKPQRIE